MARAAGRALAIYAVVAVVAGAVVEKGSHASLTLLASVLGPFAILLIGTSLWKARRNLIGYSIAISDDAVALRSAGIVAATTIARDEVTSIEEQGQCLVVRARDRRCIGIPVAIEGYASIRELLQAWQSIQTAPARSRNVWYFAATVASVAAFGWTLVADDPRVVLPLGTLVLIALIASAVYTVRQPSIALKTKWSMVMIVLPLAMIVVHMLAVIRR